MSKGEYLSLLREGLIRLEVTNVDSQVEYYEEMIDDRIEDGMTEEEAVSSMESVEDILENTRLERPVSTLVKEKVQKSRERAEKKGLSALWIALIIIGFPLWFPIILTLCILIFTFAVVFWVIIFVIFVVELAIGVSGIGCFLIPIFGISKIANLGTSIAGIGAGLVLVGICVLLWRPFVFIVKGSAKAFAACLKGIKKALFR